MNWKSHLVHIAGGIVIGYFGSLPLAALIIAREALTKKESNTPGIDLTYWLGGALVGQLIVRILTYI